MKKYKIFLGKLNNDSGSTLVEVVVAFIMLLIISASVLKVVDLAGEMSMSGQDMINDLQDINSVMYLDDEVVKSPLFYDVPYTGVTVQIMGDGYLALTLDEEKTSPYNMAKYVHIPLKDSQIKYYETKDRFRFFLIK